MTVFRMTRCLIVVSALFSTWAFAQSPTELEFKSAYDHFTLQKSGARYVLDGHAVSLGPFEDFLSLFSSAIEGPCPESKPDVTVTAKVNGQPVMRKFHIKDRVISDGKQCASVNGDGIFLTPLHRSWFDENATAKIAIKSPFKITRGTETLAWFEMHKGEWRNAQPETFPNWEFFSTFQDNIADFPITRRVHRAAVKETPDFVLVTGAAKYRFFKYSGSIWLVALPKTPWLVGSSRWSNWLDMERSQWLDRSAAQLQFIADKGKQLDERRGTLGSLEGQWSPSIRDLLTRILLDKGENNEMKLEAARLMKQKPTKENIGTMVKALGETQDADLQYSLTQALRVRNPKGKVITPEMEENLRSKALSEWQQWWNGIKNDKNPF